MSGELKPVRVIRREAIYIPIKDLTPKVQDRLKEKLTFSFFKKEKICQDCEWFHERINDICESCANYTGSYELASKVKVKDNRYFKLPVGSWKTIRAFLEKHIDIKVKSKHPDVPIRPFKFTGDFRDGQKEAIKAMLKYKRGILQAPPRSGKTVMGTALVSILRQKTLILASQRDWLMGFKETFVGSETQKPLTNLKPLRIKLCKTLKDFQEHDVCLATVQTFYSPGGEKLLKKLRDMFNVILVDECFPRGTLVTTQSGLLPIETVVANFKNYQVLSFNHEAGAWEFRQVTNGFIKKTRKNLLRIKTQQGEFTCTEDHEIFSVTRNCYVKAKDLRVDDELMSAYKLD